MRQRHEITKHQAPACGGGENIPLAEPSSSLTLSIRSLPVLGKLNFALRFKHHELNKPFALEIYFCRALPIRRLLCSRQLQIGQLLSQRAPAHRVNHCRAREQRAGAPVKPLAHGPRIRTVRGAQDSSSPASVPYSAHPFEWLPLAHPTPMAQPPAPVAQPSELRPGGAAPESGPLD